MTAKPLGLPWLTQTRCGKTPCRVAIIILRHDKNREIAPLPNEPNILENSPSERSNSSTCALRRFAAHLPPRIAFLQPPHRGLIGFTYLYNTHQNLLPDSQGWPKTVSRLLDLRNGPESSIGLRPPKILSSFGGIQRFPTAIKQRLQASPRSRSTVQEPGHL